MPALIPATCISICVSSAWYEADPLDTTIGPQVKDWQIGRYRNHNAKQLLAF